MTSFEFGFCQQIKGMKEEGIRPLSPSLSSGKAQALAAEVENHGRIPVKLEHDFLR